jgi:biotin operon repressor
VSKVDIRRQNILKFISDNKTVSTSQIMEHFNIRKATLSEDITALKSQGVPLITTRGFVSIEDNKSSANYYEKISNSTIRQWLILFILSQSNKPITFKTIQEEYQNYNYGYCSTDSLHKDLQTLQANNYIHYSDNNHTYKLTNKYNHYITPLLDSLEPFCDKYVAQIESTPNALELKRFHDTAQIMLFGFEDDDAYQPNENYIVHGKRNLLDEATKSLR